MLAMGWLGIQDAGAFCGTYVGPAGSEPVNGASRVALVFQDGRTTLTLANDYDGDVADFGLLMPVPSTLLLDDVRVVDAGAINDLDTYSAPRLVSYTCDDVEQHRVTNSNPRYVNGEPAGGCGGSSGSGGYTTTTTTTDRWTTGGGLGDQRMHGVAVQAVGQAGEYELALLDPTDGLALGLWADQQGFDIDRVTAELLDRYVQGGAWFLAARVSLDALGARTWLSPLQISYDASSPGLPILLGTASSGLEQDVTIFAVNRFEQGWMGISNYAEVPVPAECLYDGALAGLGEWYDAELAAAVQAPSTWTAEPAEPPRASWVVEYAWGQGKCDPCSTLGTLPDPLLQDLGWVGTATEAFVTRIHLRYGPDQVDEDPVLYLSGNLWNSQIRYVEHEAYLEGLFPLCDGGWGAGGETCGDETYRSATSRPARGPTRLEVLGLPIPERPSAAVPAGLGLLGLAVAAGRLRRR